MKKTDVLIINQSEYELNQIKDIKKKCNLYNLENPTQSDLSNFIKTRNLHSVKIIITNLGVYIDAKIINQFPNLKYVISPTTGLNHIDTNCLKRKKIKLFSLKNKIKMNKVTSTAEHAWALILGISRNLISYHIDTMINGKWNRNLHLKNNFQLSGKVLGILGYGRLGKMINKYAKSFGMKVLIFDKNSKKKKIKNFCTLEKIFKISDIVSINLSYNERTENLITKKILKNAKVRQILINTSRGEIIQESALAQYLNPRKKRYIGLDVLRDDFKWSKKIPRSKLNFLTKYKKRILLTPHVGGVSIDAKEITREMTLNNLKKILSYKNL